MEILNLNVIGGSVAKSEVEAHAFEIAALLTMNRRFSLKSLHR